MKYHILSLSFFVLLLLFSLLNTCLCAQSKISSQTIVETADAKVLPDLLCTANASWGYVILPNHPLQVGDKVCIANLENGVIVTVLQVYKDGFQVDSEYSGELFLYGRLHKLSLPATLTARKARPAVAR